MYYIRTFTPEMIADLSLMGLGEFATKWKIDRSTAGHYCKNNGIIPYNNAGGRNKKFTQDMVDDLGKMGNKDFEKKWGISQVTISNARKKYDKKFNNIGGKIDHKIIDGVECKWCSKKHWEPLCSFTKYSPGWDGLASMCNFHRHEFKKVSRIRCDENGKQRAKRKDPAYKERFRAKDQRSHSIRKHAHISWTDGDSVFVHELFNHRCAYCGKDVTDKFEIDHFRPIKLGGLTEPKNMVLSCPKCNHEKNAFEPMEWLTKKFGEDRAILIYRDIKNKLKLVRKVEYEQVSLLPS